MNQIILTVAVFSIVFYNFYPFTEVWKTVRLIFISLIWILTHKEGWRHVKRFWGF